MNHAYTPGRCSSEEVYDGETTNETRSTPMASSALLTDHYELTMLQAALESGAAHRRGTFELFARKLPTGRRYGVVAGIDRALQAVADFRFTEEQLAHLKEQVLLNEETLEYLRSYEFRGAIRGYREGDFYFPYSPILTVEGTFGDAVLLETVLLSIMNHDSAVASAASRMVLASRGEFPLIEMGSRRTHESAAVAAARAAYLTGFAATSNLEAGLRYGIPTRGTSAHAFTLAHADEMEAFRGQLKALGLDTTLLVDTYDIEQGIRNAVAAARELGAEGPGGVRIDSGDLHEEPHRARRLLDSLGARATKITVSSDIDEYSIEELVERGTPVDGVGAGTRVVTGSGHPTAGMVFKLVEREDENGRLTPVAKRSAGKKSVGGHKYAYRELKDGLLHDEYYVVGHSNERAPALQVTYVRGGKLVYRPTLEEAREVHTAGLATLPASARSMAAGEPVLEAREG